MTSDGHREAVPPVASDRDRPLWSVMIPTHHCAGYLRETLASVLEQAPGPELMQIEVVDDHSVQDDPEAVTRELGKGRVEFFRQPTNVGHVRNFNTCLQRSRGRLVHLLHGDDAVRPGFYSTLGSAFACDPAIGAAFCRYIAMDGDSHWHTVGPLLASKPGVLDGWLETIAKAQRLQPPSIVVRRDVYEHLGGFDDRIREFGEDWEMWTRIAGHYPVWYEPLPLALYRQRPASLSRGALATGQNLRDLARAIAINRDVLPTDRANAISDYAIRDIALSAIRRSHRMLHAGDMRAPLVQLRAAVRLSPTPRVFINGSKLLADWGITRARQIVGQALGRRPPDPTSRALR